MQKANFIFEMKLNHSLGDNFGYDSVSFGLNVFGP